MHESKKRSRSVTTKLGDVLAAKERERAAELAEKSYAAGDRRTPAQRAHRVTWYRGRALRAELIAAGVLIPPGHDPAGGTKVLEIDARGISEAAREIFWDSPSKEAIGYDMAAEVIDDFATDERVQELVHGWICARATAEDRGDTLERPAPDFTLPVGYEIDFFAWQRTRRAATAARKGAHLSSSDPDVQAWVDGLVLGMGAGFRVVREGSGSK